MPMYNQGFPATYQPIYYQQPVQPQMTQQMPQQNQQQYPAVPSGFVRVMNENEARMYPVAPGNSVTFINENLPYCYTKTVNMGQLDRPIFEKYRLVKEDDDSTPTEAPNSAATVQPADLSAYVTKSDLDGFKAELEAIKGDIEAFRGDLYGIAGKKKAPVKKEAAPSE